MEKHIRPALVAWFMLHVFTYSGIGLDARAQQGTGAQEVTNVHVLLLYDDLSRNRMSYEPIYAPESREQIDDWRLVAGGAVGWAVGLIGGAAIGYWISPPPEDTFFPWAGGIATGGLVGSSLGAPMGVHLANKRQGIYPVGALASGGVQALATYAWVALNRKGHPVAADRMLLIAAPLAQLGVSISLERATARWYKRAKRAK